MSEPTSRFGQGTAGSDLSATSAIGRGLEEIPILRDGLGLTWLIAAIGAGGRIVVPVVIQQAVDRGIIETDDGNVDMGFVVWCAIIGVVAQIVTALSNRTAIVRLGNRAERALTDLRSRLIGHIHRISIADHNEERRGALVARVTSDIETMAEFFRWGALAWLIDGTLIFIVAAAMLAYNWLLALIAIATIFPLAMLLRLVQRRLVAAYSEARQHNGEMLGSIGELVSGSTSIRSYRVGPKMAGRAKAVAGSRFDSQIRANVFGAVLYPMGEIFAVFALATIVLVGITVGPATGLTTGGMIGFIFLTYRFFEPIAELTEILDQTQNAVSGLRRVLGVFDVPVGPPPTNDPIALPTGRFDIAVKNVTFAYRSRANTGISDDIVLENIDLYIPAGQQIAIVGETGSGKTTLGRLIARFADPVGGEIRLGGVALPRVSNTELRRRLIVVAQEPFLFDHTLEANIHWSRPHASRGDINSIIDLLDLRDWIDTLPNGLATVVGERGGALSAGERQLVALLRAGLADPDVLLLDEATSAVDALTEVRIAHALSRLAQGRTTISIAHRLSTAARADRVVVLAAGRKIEDGPHSQLVTQGGVYARLYDSWVAATSAE